MTIGIQAFAELLDHSQKIAKFFMVLSIRLLDFIDGYLSRELICNAITLSCPSSRPVAQKTGDINGTSPSDLFQQLLANWQQRPPGPALIRRFGAVCSHSVLVPYSRFCPPKALSKSAQGTSFKPGSTVSNCCIVNDERNSKGRGAEPERNAPLPTGARGSVPA